MKSVLGRWSTAAFKNFATGPSRGVTVSCSPHSSSSGPPTLSKIASGRGPGGPDITDTNASSAPSAPAHMCTSHACICNHVRHLLSFDCKSVRCARAVKAQLLASGECASCTSASCQEPQGLMAQTSSTTAMHESGNIKRVNCGQQFDEFHTHLKGHVSGRSKRHPQPPHSCTLPAVQQTDLLITNVITNITLETLGSHLRLVSFTTVQ